MNIDKSRVEKRYIFLLSASTTSIYHVDKITISSFFLNQGLKLLAVIYNKKSNKTGYDKVTLFSIILKGESVGFYSGTYKVYRSSHK
ncbi:hypothetical protein BuS5_02410 [Desulfosarcina sp. BuS5]|nr:hypothetical protein BuS5_02410 [Desulfosarcina sp. BuS5]